MDPSVLLKSTWRPQWPDPVEDRKKLLTLRDLMDQRRIREQQYQLQQQAMQEHARKAQWEGEDRTRQMNLREFLSQNPNATFSDIAKYDLPTAIKIDTEQRQREAVKRQAEKAALDLQGERAKREANTYAAVTALPQDQQQDWWDTNVGGGLPVDRPPTALEEQAKYAEAYGGEALQKRRDAQEKAIRENALYAIDVPKHIAEAKTAQDKAEGKEPATGSLREFESAFYPGWLADRNLPPSATNQYKAYLDWQEGRRPRIAVPGTDVPLPPAVAQQKIDIANATRQPGTAQYGAASTLTGEDFLNTLKPGQAALIKAIAEGRESLAGRSSKDVIALKQAVQQYDPQFSDQRAAVRKAFTTGKEGQNLGAINTAVVHLGRLADTAESLKNGSFTPGNEMYQYFKDKFGSQAVTNFQLLKDAVAGEMAAALKGTATDVEIANMKQSIRASNSPEQMRGVVKEGMGVLSDKAKTYDDRYHAQMPDDPWSPILPTAKDALQKFGVPYTGSAKGASPQAGGIVVKHKNKAYSFSSQEKADAFKKEMGIQ
jgi:hypothetical protein